jgi:hypothetical protein
MRSVLGGPIAASVALCSSRTTREERSGDLTTMEHEVVKTVAKDRLRQGLPMSHDAVMKEYHRQFPAHTRQHGKLMSYWKTYKNGAAWHTVVTQINEEKQKQKSQLEN